MICVVLGFDGAAGPCVSAMWGTQRREHGGKERLHFHENEKIILLTLGPVHPHAP